MLNVRCFYSKNYIKIFGFANEINFYFRKCYQLVYLNHQFMLYNYNTKLPHPKNFPGVSKQRYFKEGFKYKCFYLEIMGFSLRKSGDYLSQHN